MIKTHKKKLILTSIIILLPALVGLILWNTLPDRLATHWGISGEADGWGTKAFAIFVPPVITLAVHWVCVLATAADPKNREQNRKAKGMVLWICPVISVFSSAVIYSTALGWEFNMAAVTALGIGLMFVIIGNYLPKCKQNYTIGIKVPWALHDEENWNATHRFGGKVWVIGGFLLMLTAFLPEVLFVFSMIVVLLVMSVMPIVYSYLFFKKQLQAGSVSPQIRPEDIMSGRIMKYTFLFVALVFAVIGFTLFSGNIEVLLGDDSFTIEASYWEDLEVAYSDIEAIEYRETDNPGTRVWGYGSFRLLMGAFQNEEFGSYTRYSYYPAGSSVILTLKGKTLVIGCIDAETTHGVYKALTAKMEG